MHLPCSSLVIVMTFALASAWTGGEARAASVLTGIDVLIQDDFRALTGKRVGLITNPTGVTRDLRSTVDVLSAAENVDLVKLFGPEHGLRGDLAGGREVKTYQDQATGLPVYSLYGEHRKPSAEMLDGLDVLVYDIQDIGCRSYTFVNTMAYAMEAAAEHGIEFYVLDRPNPLTGSRIEGNILDPKFRSFIGLFEIPYVYGLTCGELARMINGEGWLAGGVKCKLTVIPMKGWRRDMWFDETGLPWVPTSPHIPRADVAMYYVATGIMGELGVINEGVGYTLPFELAGAPWIDPQGFAAALNAKRLPGVRFRPLTYRPYYGRYKDQTCGGVQVHVTDRQAVNLVAIQFHVMEVHQKMYPNKKLFGGDRDGMFDKACGTDAVRKMFLEGKSADSVLEAWQTDAASFREKSRPYWLY